MGKLDPTQADRWWKSRIEKEELHYGLKGDAAKSPRKDATFLNTLGTATINASESHLFGPGAQVRPNLAQEDLPQAPGEDARSVASLPRSAAAASEHGASSKPASKQGSRPASKPASKPASVASAAQRSAAAAAPASEAKSSKKMLQERLDGLADALAAERTRRLAVEEEMRQLMALQAAAPRKGPLP